MSKYVVPYYWYRRIGRIGNEEYTIFDNRESINGMSFFSFPFTQDYSNPEAVAQAIVKNCDSGYNDEDISRLAKRICGYAVIDAHLVELLEKVPYNPGNDSASDAIGDFMVAFCVAHAEKDVKFRIFLDNYATKKSEYVTL